MLSYTIYINDDSYLYKRSYSNFYEHFTIVGDLFILVVLVIKTTIITFLDTLFMAINHKTIYICQ
jgi:hypothetical protein